jgi:hypothetical protein
MNKSTDHRMYYVCKEPSTYDNKYDFYEPKAHKTDCFLENPKKYECRPIGDNSNLRFFKEEANIKHICKHIPAELRKNVFETKYPDSTIISLLEK